MKQRREIAVNWCFRASCLSVLFILLGCASGAHVIPSVAIPVPLIDSFPKSVGIYYSPELTEYVYNEKKRRQSFIIELGVDQERIFNRSLGALFDKVVILDAKEDPNKTVDGIFYPSIRGMTVTVPWETGREYYEVWIQYELQLLEPNGVEEIDKWVFAAYGRVHRKDYGSVMERTNEAMLQATENALRDGCTETILLFSPRRIPAAVQQWLKQGPSEEQVN